jgi:predicted RNA-binding protein with PIN domain
VPVVIDGYNLLHARGDGPSAASRGRLVRDLVRWAGVRQRRAVVVFDAWAQGERVEREETHGPVTVWFTRYGERADDWIVRWVSGHPEAVVVTSDRAVAQGARRRGAAVLGAGAFAERIDAALAGEAEDEGEAPAPGRHASRQAGWLRGL